MVHNARMHEEGHLVEGTPKGGLPDSSLAEGLISGERLLLIAITTFLPLAYGPGIFNDVFNLPKLSLLMVAVALTGSLRLAAFILGVRSKGLPALLLPAALMILALTLAWLLGDHRWWSLLGAYVRFAGWLPYVVTILFGVLLGEAFAGAPKTIVTALVAGGSAVGIVALKQMLFSGFEIGFISPGAYITSTIGDENFAGGYFAVMLVLSITLWLGTGRESKLGMVATILTGAGLIFTMSQAAWLGAAGGITALIAGITSRQRPARKRILLALAAVIAVIPAATVMGTLVLGDTYEDVPGVLQSAFARGLFWKHAVDVILERPLLGFGPNSFFFEGSLQRGVDYALFLGADKTDDPHSVPLAMLVNAGLLGGAAFIFAIAWGLRKLTIMSTDAPMRAGLFGALAAYAAQALVSIDEMALRFTLWALLAAVAATLRPRASRYRRARGPNLRILALVVVILGVLVTTVAVRALVVPDLAVAEGVGAYYQGQPELALALLAKGLDGRNEPEYRRIYGGVLGNIAFNQGPAGKPLIEEMNEVFGYLEDFPDPQALLLQGQLLNQWSVHEPSANTRALEIFQRIQRMDPNDPLPAIHTADVLVQLGRARQAQEVLAPYIELMEEYPEYSPRYGELWSALAIAEIKQGRFDEASQSLDRAAEPRQCRFHLATNLLRAERGLPPTGVQLGFICPNAMRSLLDEQERATSTT